jgi:hypothetical protein
MDGRHCIGSSDGPEALVAAAIEVAALAKSTVC